MASANLGGIYGALLPKEQVWRNTFTVQSFEEEGNEYTPIDNYKWHVTDCEGGDVFLTVDHFLFTAYLFSK